MTLQRLPALLSCMTIATILVGCKREGATSVSRPEEGGETSIAKPEQTSISSGSSTPRPSKALTLPMELQHGHTGAGCMVMLTPDSRRLLTMGAGDRTLKLWDLSTSRVVWQAKPLMQGPMAVAQSPDGKFLALHGATRFLGDGIPVENVLRILDAQTGQELDPFPGLLFGGAALAFSPDSKLLLSGHHDYTMRLWDVTNRREQASIRRKGYFGSSVAFSPDGQRALAADGKYMEVWDLKNRKPIHTLEPGNGAWQVFWLPDGQHALSSNKEGSVRTWDVKQGKEVRHFQAQVFNTHLSLSADGRRAITTGSEEPGNSNHTLQLWDVPTGKRLLRLEDKKMNTGYGNTIIAPNGAFAVSSALNNNYEAVVRVFEIPSR